MIDFPSNPTNGDVFEYTSGIYYQYNSQTKSWKKIVGLSSVPLATPNNDGLMSKDDFKKLQSLMIPPPQTTLTADECNTTFKEGIIKIESTNNDLNIATSLNVLNNSQSEKVDFIIHENTFGIDFTININRLIEELQTRGKIKYRAVIGPQGDQGDRGKPGRDRIETGPRGLKGKDGSNAPFTGTLVQDFSTVDQTKIKKVVVDIKNDPDDPKKLIVVFGNIGNLTACPNRVHWKNKNTPWLVAVKDKIGPCKFPSGCYKNVCASDIYYIDTTTIQEQIKNRFIELLAAVKLDKEVTVKNWLNAMIEMFNSQKQALCCAIEAIDSKQRNQNIRDSWSMARYAAAQSMYAFKLTSDDDKKYPYSEQQQTPYDFLSGYSPQKGSAVFNGTDPDIFNCSDCFLIVDLLGYNIGQTRPISVDLPAGSYISTIVQCCSDFENVGSSGRYSIKFVDKDADNNSYYNTYISTNKGYLDSAQANAAYTGESMAFKHYGGTVSFFLTPPPPNSSPVSLSGGVKLCIQPTKCFEACKSGNPTDITGVTTVTDQTAAELPASYIRASHAEFYERGWRIGKACAAHTSIIGTQFIVVYRSIGADVSCGGGEYPNTPFIKYFNDQLGEQVAVAWPTIDGDGFFGLPRDDGNIKIQLVYDQDLSDMIVNNIKNDVVFKTIGDPKNHITKVVVPILESGYTDGTSDPSTPDVLKAGIKWSFNTTDPLKPVSIIDDSKVCHTGDCISSGGSYQITQGTMQAISGQSYFNWIINWNVAKKLLISYDVFLTSSKCISAWYKHTSVTNTDIEIYMGHTDNTLAYSYGSYLIKLYISGTKDSDSECHGIVLVTQKGSDQAPGTISFQFALPRYIPADSWTHVVFNRISDRYISLYINGEKIGTIGPVAIGTGEYKWGPDSHGFRITTKYFDQFRLYNDKLTDDDISNLYLRGRSVN
jgi:hypothetical protein